MSERIYGKVRLTSNELIDTAVALTLPAFEELLEPRHQASFADHMINDGGTVLEKVAKWVGFANGGGKEYGDGTREYILIVDSSWNSLYSEMFLKYICELGMGVEAELTSSTGGGTIYNAEMESGIIVRDSRMLVPLGYLTKVRYQSQRWEETLEILENQGSEESKLEQIRELSSHKYSELYWAGTQL